MVNASVFLYLPDSCFSDNTFHFIWFEKASGGGHLVIDNNGWHAHNAVPGYFLDIGNVLNFQRQAEFFHCCLNIFQLFVTQFASGSQYFDRLYFVLG